MNRSNSPSSAFSHGFYTTATSLQSLLFHQIPNYLSAQKTGRFGIMTMMQISQNIPFPALALCSSAQLEPAVGAGPQPRASPRTASRQSVCWRKGPGAERGAATAAQRPRLPSPTRVPQGRPFLFDTYTGDMAQFLFSIVLGNACSK